MMHLLWLYTESPRKTLDAATWLETTRELKALGWQVTLVVVGDTTGWEDIQGIRVYSIERPQVYLLGLHRFHMEFLRLALAQWQTIDVILFHQMSAPWIFFLRLRRLFQRRHKPLIVMDNRTLHMTATQNSSLRDQLRRLYYSLVNKSLVYWTDGQLAITRRLAEAVHIAPKKLWGVWPSGVTAERFASAVTTRVWPHHDTPIRLIYTGSLYTERNLLALCEAVEDANTQGMSFHLLLIGEGSQRAELEVFASKTDARIQVLPPVPHVEIPDYLVQAHIGVLPFPDEERFRVSSPIKLFEYMASGLAILATRVVCHTDVIGSGSYAFWAEGSDRAALAESLVQVWQARDQLQSMGLGAVDASGAWTWQEAAKKLKTALEFGIEMRASKG